MSQTESRIGAPPLPVVNMPGALPGGPMMRPMPNMPVRGTPPVVLPGGPVRGPGMGPVPGQGGGRWSQAPGGWNAYRPPSYGFTLPRYWVSAPFFISNYSLYGLPRPTAGYGWSRYYDDAVLTDRYGRVYDWRSDLDWSRDGRWSSEDYSDSYGYRDDREAPRPRRNNDGVAGAVIGGVVGGVAGNIIGGDGNRLAGTLIGGGLGAIAGAAIDKSTSRDRDRAYRDDYRDDYRGFEGREVRPSGKRGKGRDYSYEGTWNGSWDGGPSRTYTGRFDGNVRPHWDGGYAGGGYYEGGSRSYSYRSGWGEGPSVTTVVVTPGAPIVTKTVSYVTEYVTVPARTKYVKRAKYVKRCGC
jgi:hypothetical protein